MNYPHESDLTQEDAEEMAGKISLLVNSNRHDELYELMLELSPDEQLDIWQYLHSSDRTKIKNITKR